MTPTNQPNGADDGKHDAVLLTKLDVLLDRADPVPEDLVDRVLFAIDLERLDVEVAHWERADRMAGVRGNGPNTVTFTVEDLTVMVTFVQDGMGYRFDGWLVPGGPHTVELRVSGHGSTTTEADDTGRFAVAEVPRGTTQIVIHLAHPNGSPARTVVTPTLML